MTLDLLLLGPHPDDVELSCGGLVAVSADRGYRVGIVDLTRGERATSGTVAGRAEEAQKAAEVLGVAVRSNLGLPDTGLRADEPEHIAAVVGAIRKHRPHLLVAPWTEARHPDHAAAGRLAQHAMMFAGVAHYRTELGPRFRPTRLLHYPQRHEARPDLVVDISEVVQRKRDAIACHASQFGAAASPHRRTLINQPLGVAAFDVRDRYWGATIGVAYAEPYVLGAPVPMRDPVAHFRDHAEPPVLRPPP